jgi:Fe2+ or Zn2+ uptake regulation protein
MIHPEGHRLRPILDDFFLCEDGRHAHMICRTCGAVCPDAETDCID